MDRYVSQDGEDFQYGTVGVDLKFTSDGTDSAIVPTVSAGIASVTNSSGTYTATFEDAYVQFLNAYGTCVQASFSAAGASDFVVISTAQVSGDPLSVAFAFAKGSDGTIVQPSADDVLNVHFRLQRFDANASAQ